MKFAAQPNDIDNRTVVLPPMKGKETQAGDSLLAQLVRAPH